MSYAKIVIVGSLGRDPDAKYMPSGQMVCNFSVATNRTYTKNDERVKETTWYRVSTWGNLAETCNQYLKTGKQVLIEGRLTPDKETGGPRVYESNGEHRASYELTADRVVFLGGKNQEQEDPAF